MSTPQSERLRTLLEPLATAAGLDLEQIAVVPAGKRRLLRVVVDREGGVQLDTVAELSRAISEALDASDAMGGAPYVLEVTSPGTDRPLTEPRHFERNVGRLVKAHLSDGSELTARILGVDAEGLDLEVPGVKGRRPTPRRLGFGEISRARVELEFNRPGPDGTESPDGSGGESGGAPDAGGPRTAQDDGADHPAAADSDESPEEA